MKAFKEQPVCGRWTPLKHLLQGVVRKIRSKSPTLKVEQQISFIQIFLTSAVTDNYLRIYICINEDRRQSTGKVAAPS